MQCRGLFFACSWVLCAACALPDVTASRPSSTERANDQSAAPDTVGADKPTSLDAGMQTSVRSSVPMPASAGAPALSPAALPAGSSATVAIGAPCSKPESVACLGAASAERVRCVGDRWAATDACSGGARCDDANMMGECRPMAAKEGCGDLMTDAKNCGACGHACRIGECMQGVCQPQTIATGRVMIGQVIVDNGTVFYSDCDRPSADTQGCKLQKIARDGGKAETLVEETVRGMPFTLDADNLYVLYPDFTIHKLPRAGGASSVVSESSCGNTPYAAKGYLYCVSDDLHRQPVSGGPSMKLDDGHPNGITFNASMVFWQNAGELKSMQLSGGGIRTLAQTNSSVIAADSDNLYWSTTEGIYKLPLNAAGAAVRVSDEPVGQLVLDATHMYVRSGKGIGRLPIAGGSVDWLVTEGSAWSSLAQDADYVYWANSLSPSTVKRLAK